MAPDEAADALTEVAASHQDEMEAVYRAILLDLLVKHGDRGFAWSHIQDVANLDGMAKMQGAPGPALSKRFGSTKAWTMA